jgi:hypothetical protein
MISSQYERKGLHMNTPPIYHTQPDPDLGFTIPCEINFSRITNEKQHALYEHILKDVLPMPFIDIIAAKPE